MDKKKWAFHNELGNEYQLTPNCPIQNDADKKWYYYSLSPDAPRIYALPGDGRRGKLNKKTLSIAERLDYAQKIADYYHHLQQQRNTTPVLEVIDSDIVAEMFSLLESKKKELRKSSYENYESKIRIFAAYLLKENITVVDNTVIAHFLTTLANDGRGNATINAYRTMLRSYLPENCSNATEKTKALPNNPDGAMYFTATEIVRLRDSIETNYPQLWLACMFVMYTFARPRAELLNLKIGDIDFQNHLLTFRAEISKNKKTQSVVIPRPLMDMIHDWKLMTYPKNYYIIGHDGKPSPIKTGDDKLGRLFRKILISLGFNPEIYYMYGLKNSGIIFGIQSGIDVVSMQRQVRHHSLDQLNEYLVKVGVLQCPNLYTHFRSIDQLAPTKNLIDNYAGDFLKMLRAAQRHEVSKPHRYELSLIRAEIDRIIG